MNTGYLMLVFMVLAIIILLIIKKLARKAVRPPMSEFPLEKATGALSYATTGAENKWWRQLNNADQLALAVSLAELALPVWEKYTAAEPASYLDTTSLTTTLIDKNLLTISLKEIKAVNLLFPDLGYKKINNCYNQFIGPVIALQDGDWMPPYAIKKLFLSFYNILKGITENNKVNYNEYFFAIAIDHSLDCIDMTKLYSDAEVKKMLAGYKFLGPGI